MAFTKKIFIASDHAGYKMKTSLIDFFKKAKINYTDLGTKNETTSVDYPTYAFKLGQKVAKTTNCFGILVCGTGYGMCIAVNKVKGIRAVSLLDDKNIEFAITHNNINVVCLSGRFVTLEKNIKILKKLFSNKFSNETRHKNRINMISEYEK